MLATGNVICVFVFIHVALFVHYLLPVSEQIIHSFWNLQIDSQPVMLKTSPVPDDLFKNFCQLCRGNTSVLNILITFCCCFSLLLNDDSVGLGGGGGELFLKPIRASESRRADNKFALRVGTLCVLLLKLSTLQTCINIPDTHKIGNSFLHVTEEEAPCKLATVTYVKQSREQLSAKGLKGRNFWLLAMCWEHLLLFLSTSVSDTQLGLGI